MARKLTTDEFIRKAKEVHGDKYDYSKVVYENAKTKVIIICPIHGEFLQISNNHLQDQGCPKCGKEVGREKLSSTKEEFISRSKSVWGENTFDYDKVEYVNSQTKVTLICKKHNNEFEQVSKYHLQGRNGCLQCLMEVTGSYNRGFWTYDKCYEIAKKYEWLSDFSKKDYKCYIASHKKGYFKDFTWLKRNYEQDEDIITSKKHLIYKYEFLQFNSVYIGLTGNLEKRHRRGHCKKSTVYNFCKMNNLEIPQPQIIEDNLTLDEAKIREGYWIKHYRGQGCKLLNKAKAGSVGMLYKVKTGKETEQFIDKARRVHGEKYDYLKVKYENNCTKVIITCPIHGDFEQAPSSHLLGCGCSKCGGSMKSNTEEFITKAKQVHGDRYDYTNVSYKNANTKVTIICPIHGVFKQKPIKHLYGQGCPKCGVEKVSGKRRTTREEFISKAKLIHGDKYGYSKVEYKNNQTKVIITCPTHGEFLQPPSHHIQGNGCPKCKNEKLSNIRTKWIYEACKVESMKYKTRTNFQRCNCGAYKASRKNKWLDEFYPKK